MQSQPRSKRMKRWGRNSACLGFTLLFALGCGARSVRADDQPKTVLKTETFDKNPGWDSHDNPVEVEKPNPVVQYFKRAGEAADARAPVRRAALATARPNIVLVLADDVGWGDVGWHGAEIRTPVLDRLAREGVELAQHYVNPQCTPTRSALLSGRYASRLDNLVAGDARAFPEGTMTLPRALQAAGYATALIGKWHLGTEPGARPWEQGFDTSYGALTGAVHPWSHTYRKGPQERTWHRNGRRVDETGTHTTDLLAREARAWLERQDGVRPWFLYLPFFAAHTPVDAPPAWKVRYAGVKFFDDDKQNESAVRYAAMTSHMDDAIGKVLETVRAKGWAERTLVVFLTDNGPVGSP